MKNAKAIGLAVTIACFGTPSAYALHKCTTKEGKVIYTEFECEKDAKASGVPIYDSAGVDTKKGTGTSAARTATGRSYNYPGIVSEDALRGSGLNPEAFKKVPAGGYTKAEYERAVGEARQEAKERNEKMQQQMKENRERIQRETEQQRQNKQR